MSFKYSLTPRYMVLHEKLTGPRIVKIFRAFRGHRLLIIAFTTPRHLFVTTIRSIQRSTFQFFKSTLILSPHLSLGLLNGSLSPRFPHRHPLRTALLSHTCHMPCLSHLSGFHYTDVIRLGEQIMQLMGKP